MPTRLKITIEGLCVSYYEQGQWTVVFLCDEKHPLKFTHPAGGFENVRLYVPGRDVVARFTAAGLAAVGQPKGDDFTAIFNLAADYAHGPDKLVRRRRSQGTSLVTLIVPDSTLSSVKRTDQPYFVQEVKDRPGTPVELIGTVADKVLLEVGADEPVSLGIYDQGSQLEQFDLKASAGSIDLELNNDCDGGCDYNDFIHIYEAFMDKEDDKMFVAGQIKPKRQGTKSLMSADQGNCDPTVIEPPPG